MLKSRKAIKARQGEQRALHATPVTGYLDTVRDHGVRDAIGGRVLGLRAGVGPFETHSALASTAEDCFSNVRAGGPDHQSVDSA
jgi:hypothetical protein